MVQSISSSFKNFLYTMQKSRKNIFRSGGLVFIYCWLIKTDFFDNFPGYFKDQRKAGKIKYSLGTHSIHSASYTGWRQADWLHTPVARHSNRNILKISPNRFELFKKMLAA